MIEVSPDEFVCSPSVRIRIPRVIVLKFYDRLPRREVSFSRKNIFERDKYTCQYCGDKPKDRRTALKWMEKKILNLDHVVPRSRGGKTTWDNIVSACYSCNTKKGNKLLSELGWKLRKRPAEPRWQPTINLSMKVKPQKEWRNFLDLVYYNIELENDNEAE
jgi:5-methylcytosine-specific restriction endonuclease McrA